MPIHIIDDPIGDPRWADLLARHPAVSVFHTPAWLEALRRTYGYIPFVVTTSSGARIENGLVVCRVSGWTSRRLVSLPFSDHCEPLVSEPSELRALVDGLFALSAERGWGPVEIRPRLSGQSIDDAVTS